MTCKFAFTRTHVEWNRSRSRIELLVGVSFEQEEHWSPTRLRTGEVFCQNWPIISSAVFHGSHFHSGLPRPEQSCWRC